MRDGVPNLASSRTDWLPVNTPVNGRHSRPDRRRARGAGLGDRFLGHVERTGVLLHLVDATGEDPGAAWRTVRHELEAYGHELAEKPEIDALSKIDALTPEAIKDAKKKLNAPARRSRSRFRRTAAKASRPRCARCSRRS